MERNPIRLLGDFGQSPWLDYIDRALIASGKLRRLIEEDGVKGLTSNPAIFAKAVVGTGHYDDVIARARQRAADAKAAYEMIAVRDVQDAADLLRPVFDATSGRDGFVSLEVSPTLADDTAGTVAEAHRLWQEVARPNVMIKVPGTPAGLPAFETLIAEGINVNVTLLFAREVYEKVADAYLRGLERRAIAGRNLGGVASVASFFVSRIDTAVDKLLEARAAATDDPVRQTQLRALAGKTAVANAKLAYQHYLEIQASERWQLLTAAGARSQRLLWASTGTKNPDYSDVIYVEQLVGADTVNTMPPATLDAFRAHGKVGSSLTDDVAGAREVLSQLGAAGISLQEVTAQLLADGVRSFDAEFAKLLGAVETQLGNAGAPPP